MNNEQIKLVQTAVRAAGFRGKGFDGRYLLLLGQYMQSDGTIVTSCKQLNSWQMEDLLAICEAHGWRMPGKPEDFYRKKAAANKDMDSASFAQLSAIDNLKGDLGWNDNQLAGMVRRLTKQQKESLASLDSLEGYKLIEALKSILGRQKGKKYNNLNEVREDFTNQEVTDDSKKQV